VQTVQAERLWARGFRGDDGELLPTYFRNTEFYNLSIGVYLQVLPEKLLPRSVWVARAVPLLVIWTAMLGAGLILRDFLKLRFYWVGVLALSGFPGFFLHTRIAFELMLATAAYVWFLYFYLRYRTGSRASLFAAALFAALTFYGYNTFQPVVAATALILLAVDAPYHWKNRATVLAALALLALLTLPYWRFVRTHPEEVRTRLSSLESYWTDPSLRLPQKLARYGREYARAFDPSYWFRPDPPSDLERHTMKGYGHLPWLAAPFIAVGTLLCAWRIRAPGPRTLLVALACAPAGAAIVYSGITRAMILVVVFGLLVGVGADPILRFFARRVPAVAVGALVFAWLAIAQGRMLADALTNGPTWYRDYGLYGMQWGAREVLGEVARLRRAHPRALLVVSPIWANGMDDLIEFFVPVRTNVVIANVDWLRYERRGLLPETLAVLTEGEYQQIANDPRFAPPRIEKTIPYPDGRPGFRFVWLSYAPDFERIVAEERERWRTLVAEEIETGGVRIRVEHSVFDIGTAAHLFDGSALSLVRTERANPAVVVLHFDPPRSLQELALTIGSMQSEITVECTGPGGSGSSTRTDRELPVDPTIVLPLPPIGGPVARLKISVRDLHGGEPQHVHLREIRLR
jgi:hypothetical protein